MSGSVSQWLQELGLGQYSAGFEENDIDWDLLIDLDQETLKDIGVDSAGHRLRMLKAIKALQQEPYSPPAAEPIAKSQDTDDLAGWSRTPGERKPVTMLFADIVGSTALTEELDAEEAHDLLYRATRCMCNAVEDNNGTVCRFMGDGIMAMFGAPVASERHALEACRAALEMQQGIRAYNSELEGDQDVDLQIRVGMNSGEVVVLEVGDDPEKPEYDASGPTVPLAARMEQSAAAGTILITDSTRALAGNMVETKQHQAVNVKGVSEPVEVHRLCNILSATEASSIGNRHPFVGRKIELAQFGSLLEVCLEGSHGQTVYVRGEAGIGKTRLVEEISLHAQTRGFTQHKALVLDFGAGKGQGAISTLVRSLLDIAPGSGNGQREAALKKAENEAIADPEHRVYLNDLLDLPQPLELRTLYDAMNAETRSVGKREALSGILRNLSARKRLLIVIEDLHWADDTTLDYLASLAAALAQCAALIVMTSRVEGDPINKTWRARAGDCPITTWDLSPLRKEEAINLVSGFIDASDELARRCIERAAGNPLFLEQLLLSMSKDSSERIPDSIKGLVLTRVDQLPVGDKQALQAASVLGQRFELEGLRFLINDPDYDCEGLIEHHLLKPEGPHYLFAHALIQEGAYASLLKPHRVGLHQSAAGWFADKDSELFAEHLDHAGDEKAAQAYLHAAQQLSAQYRLKRALQLTQRGLEIADEEGRFALDCLEGEILRFLGFATESIKAYEHARDVANGEVECCRALVGMAEGLNIIEMHEELMETLREAEILASANALNYELALIYQLRGGVLFFKSESDACLRACKASLKYARAARSPEIEARALSGLGDAEYSRGHYIAAHKYFNQCIELAREHGLGRIIAANMAMRGLVSIWQNKIEAAQEEYYEALDMALKTQDLRAEMINQVGGAYYWTTTGNFDKAKECLLRSQTLSQHLGSRLIEGVCLQYRGRIEFILGNQEEAFRLAKESVEILRESESGMTFRGPAALGVLALVTNDESERIAVLAEAESLLAAGSVSHNHFNFYEDGMEASLWAGDWDEIDRFAQGLEDYTRDEPLPRCEFFIARGRALAEHGRGNRDRATMAELRRLHDEAQKFGMNLAVPALKQALA